MKYNVVRNKVASHGSRGKGKTGDMDAGKGLMI